MKEFEIEFSEIVTYSVIVEAETIEEARERFFEGDFNDCEEVDREFDNVIGIKEV